MHFVANQDSICLSQLADGDDVILGELFDRYAPAVLALLQAMLGASHEAEEQLHELFLELWRSAPAWDWSSAQPLRTWLLLRARQRALALLQLHPHLKETAPPAQLLPEGWRPPGRYDASFFDDPHFGPDRSRLRRALVRLGHENCRVLALSYLRGCKGRELGLHLRQSTRKAGRRIAALYVQLRERAHEDSRGS